MALSQEWFLKREIWLYRKPLDFRKQLDGLVHIVAAEIKLMPNDGTIYVFRNQPGQIKALALGTQRLLYGLQTPGERPV